MSNLHSTYFNVQISPNHKIRDSRGYIPQMTSFQNTFHKLNGLLTSPLKKKRRKKIQEPYIHTCRNHKLPSHKHSQEISWASQSQQRESFVCRTRVSSLMPHLYWLRKTRCTMFPRRGERNKVLLQSPNSVVTSSLQVKICSQKHTSPSLISKALNQAKWVLGPCSGQPATPHMQTCNLKIHCVLGKSSEKHKSQTAAHILQPLLPSPRCSFCPRACRSRPSVAWNQSRIWLRLASQQKIRLKVLKKKKKDAA